MKKLKLSNLNYKNIAILVAIIVLIILIIVGINSNKNKKTDWEGFEKVAIYGYLENNILSPKSLFQVSDNSDYDELQMFQLTIKQALDSYFSKNPSEKEVPSSTILSSIDNAYLVDNIDFNGIVISDYEYDFKKDVFVKSIGANSQMSRVESNSASINFENKYTVITNLEKLSETEYKVYFDITNGNSDNRIVENSGEAIITFQDDKISLKSSTLYK